MKGMKEMGRSGFRVRNVLTSAEQWLGHKGWPRPEAGAAERDLALRSVWTHANPYSRAGLSTRMRFRRAGSGAQTSRRFRRWPVSTMRGMATWGQSLP